MGVAFRILTVVNTVHIKSKWMRKPYTYSHQMGSGLRPQMEITMESL